MLPQPVIMTQRFQRWDGPRDGLNATGILHGVKAHAIASAVLVLSVSVVAAPGCAWRRPPAAGPGTPTAASSTRTAPAAGTAAISEASVRAHMEFLAGDALNGRGSGTRDEWIAAAYIAAQMRRLGLEPMGDAGGFVQAVAIQRTELTSAPVLAAGSHRFTHGKEIAVQSLGEPRVEGRLQKWTRGASVSPGAAVLLPDPVPADLPPLGRVLVLSPQTPLVRQRWQMLAGRSPRVAPRIASLAPSAATTVYLDPQAYAALSSVAEGETVTLEADSRQAPRAETWNAVGRLPGADGASALTILLSAHLDHLGSQADRPGATGDTIFNGADDDASGTVAVAELMEALARGPRPKRTIVFALFGSEESGGAGSRFFAEQPTVPLDRIAANLQFEMIGRPDPKVPPHTLWLTGYERSNLGPELARRGAKLVQDPHPDQNFFERSDNIQFARRGVVAHTVSSYGLHKEYHSPADEIGRIDFAHMTDAIRSMLEPIRWLANSDFVPAWVAGKKP